MSEQSPKRDTPQLELGIVGGPFPAVRLVHTELVPREYDPRRSLHATYHARPFLARVLGHMDREYVAVLHLDAEYMVPSWEIVSIGTVGASLVHPREVFKGAILANAKAIICAHNHPTGSNEPSPGDLAVESRLRDAGELLGIPLVDYLVLSANGYWSAYERRDGRPHATRYFAPQGS